MSDEWSRDELIIAMEFYFTCPERMHTDSHGKCQEIARMLGRTPGALDRIIRNIKYVHTGGTGLEHASRSIYELEAEFRDARQALMREAARIRSVSGWPPLHCGE